MNKMFGTNGVRGTINEELTVNMVLNLGRAIGSVLGPGQIALARDSRMGGEMFSRVLSAGLLSTGCSAIDLGLIPTPTLQFMVPRLNCVAGVMVTASHNPPEFNGIKVMGSNGIEVLLKVRPKRLLTNSVRLEWIYSTKLSMKYNNFSHDINKNNCHLII